MEIPNDAFTTRSQFPIMLIQHSVSSDWLLNTPLSVHQADWFVVEINDEATSNINMPHDLVKNEINLNTYLTTGIWVCQKTTVQVFGIQRDTLHIRLMVNPPIPVELSIDAV